VTDSEQKTSLKHNIASVTADIMALSVDDLRIALQKANTENRTLQLALAEMERVATLDTLTPVHNRRYFLSEIHRRLARIRRYGDAVIVIFVDLNNLKAINDAHGHGAGDAILMCVAARLRDNVRETDVVARIGGDEFGLLLDAMDEGHAAEKVEFLRNAILKQAVVYGDIQMQPSAAFGFARIGPDDDENTALARADAAMYQDKALKSIIG
jgi:diguanylate cyclase (GGDEF)-like protein